jgi:hypothetical protein
MGITHKRSVTILASLLLVGGCISGGMPGMPDTDRMMKQMQLMQARMKDPDRPEWYKQREQITEALGDRVFDRDFNRVFDSLVVAMATLGVHVDNMERQSGYVSATGNLLPPDLAMQLRRDEAVEWCKLTGNDPDLLDVRKTYDMDPDSMASMTKSMIGLTISLVRQGDKQTKVKLRFANAYYPKYVEECYKAVWPAIDKQMFVDKGTD